MPAAEPVIMAGTAALTAAAAEQPFALRAEQGRLRVSYICFLSDTGRVAAFFDVRSVTAGKLFRSWTQAYKHRE